MAKNFYALIDGKYTPIKSFDYSITLDVANQFTIEVAIQDLTNYRTVKGSDAQVYWGTQLIADGFVFERVSLKLTDEKVMLGKLKCYDTLGRLTCEPAISTLHLQDILVTTAIDQILTGASQSSWVRQNVNFTNELTEVATIDLRSKETLFSQLVELVKSIPSLHLRYGGQTAAGVNILEIGEFNDVTEQFMQGTNLIELDLSPLQDSAYDRIVAIGGIGRDERITLELATQDARYATDPLLATYPVTQNATTGDWEINTVGGTANCGITKTFQLQKTDNETTVSDAEKIEAGYALWHKAIAFLESKGEFDTYSGSIIAGSIPTIGDRAYLVGHVYEKAFNELTYCDDKVATFTVQDDFRIVKLSTKLDRFETIDEFGCVVDDDELIIDFEVTNGEEAQEFDDTLLLNEDANNKFSEAIPASQLNYVTDSHTGAEASDCNDAPLTNGKLFTFTPTGFPSTATVVSFGIALLDPSNIQYVVTQQPTIDPAVNDLILCVAPNNGDWNTLAASDTITVQVVFSYA